MNKQLKPAIDTIMCYHYGFLITKNMIGIKCKSGHVFSACNENYIDAEWKLQEAYYKAQGCEVELSDEVRFSECNCEHCQSLEHEFENLIEEVKSEA